MSTGAKRSSRPRKPLGRRRSAKKEDLRSYKIEPEAAVLVPIAKCRRCGLPHRELYFRVLAGSRGVRYTLCPLKLQPIFLLP